MRDLVLAVSLTLALLFLVGCAGPNPPDTNTSNTSGPIAINTNLFIGEDQVLPAATSGQLYNKEIMVSGGNPPYNCSAAPGTSLPGDLVFSEPGCSITGTAPTLPPQTPAATYPIQFIALDSDGKVGGPFTLNLLVEAPKVELKLSGVIDNATIGKKYEYNFCEPIYQTEGYCAGLPNAGLDAGSPPFTFTSSGQPLGLTMNQNGKLSGTVPEGANTGEYTVRVCMTDMAGSESCANTILAVNSAPVEESCKSPYDGEWTGTVTSTGFDTPFDLPKKPYSISYTFQFGLKCAYLDTDSKDGGRIYWFNYTHIKFSDPFFGCTNGCEPVRYARDTSDDAYLPEPGTKGSGIIDFKFPNGVEFGTGFFDISPDGKTMVEYMKNDGSVGEGEHVSIETRGCSECGWYEYDNTEKRIVLTKVG